MLSATAGLTVDATGVRDFGRFNGLTLQRFNEVILGGIAVVADRFDRAAFHRFFAKPFFFRRLWLFIDVRVAAVIVSFEISRRGFAAQIAINALIIDVEFARYVFGVFVRGI